MFVRADFGRGGICFQGFSFFFFLFFSQTTFCVDWKVSKQEKNRADLFMPLSQMACAADA